MSFRSGWGLPKGSVQQGNWGKESYQSRGRRGRGGGGGRSNREQSENYNSNSNSNRHNSSKPKEQNMNTQPSQVSSRESVATDNLRSGWDAIPPQNENTDLWSEVNSKALENAVKQEKEWGSNTWSTSENSAWDTFTPAATNVWDNSADSTPVQSSVVSTQNESGDSPNTPTPATEDNPWSSESQWAAWEDDCKKKAEEQESFMENEEQRLMDNYNVDVNKLPLKNQLLSRSEALEKILFPLKTNNTDHVDFTKYDDIPVELTGPSPVPEPISLFAAADMGPVLQNNIALAHYANPFPVQRYSIPVILDGHCLMACAQTGSGKTAAFLFPIITQILNNGRRDIPKQAEEGRNKYCCYPSALILAPTRELCTQIFTEARRFCYRSPIRPVAVYGGAMVMPQVNELAKGCDILVATPGRLVDMIKRGYVSLTRVAHLCLDEADRMLDMGFEPQIRNIVEERDMPAKTQRQTLMFSATFPKPIQQLATDFLKEEFYFLHVGRVGAASNTITQKFYLVENHEKRKKLMELLDCNPDAGVLVFTETKRSADDLESRLSADGYPAVAIHGDRRQYQREAALSAFKSGAKRVLVATDVASRGLDMPTVAIVVNYELSDDVDDYVHRIGRTGRAGKDGLAVTFMNNYNNDVAEGLIEVLTEAKVAVPDWMVRMAAEYKANRSENGGGRGRRGGRGGGRGGGAAGGGRPGDWPCPSCGANNFARRTSCFRCSASKA
eukprot:GCRY01000879.1.p1 GENE.GCRY01000879.1~~GCRY01000879.1.p1  ORF type:complete len:727 (+),score=167.01 GCRY01000879.1:119-2299(+)